MLGLAFSSELGQGTQIVSIAKTASKKVGALVRFMKFVSPDGALYLYKSTIRPCLQYYCHVWTSTAVSYLDILDNLQMRLRRTVGPTLAASLSSAQVFFVCITQVDVRLNWLNWFRFLILVGVPLVTLIDCMIFRSPFPDVIRMSMSTVFSLSQLDSGILCLHNAFL